MDNSVRGVDMGPSAIRYAGLQERLELLGFQVEDDRQIFVLEQNGRTCKTR